MAGASGTTTIDLSEATVVSNDNLVGGSGNDYLYAGAGNDRLNGGSGRNSLPSNNSGAGRSRRRGISWQRQTPSTA
jgi:Ca2+-binding RTX toxin-like protein